MREKFLFAWCLCATSLLAGFSAAGLHLREKAIALHQAGIEENKRTRKWFEKADEAAQRYKQAREELEKSIRAPIDEKEVKPMPQADAKP